MASLSSFFSHAVYLLRFFTSNNPSDRLWRLRIRLCLLRFISLPGSARLHHPTNTLSIHPVRTARSYQSCHIPTWRPRQHSSFLAGSRIARSLKMVTSTKAAAMCHSGAQGSVPFTAACPRCGSSHLTADRRHRQMVALPRPNSDSRPLPPDRICARSEKDTEGPPAPRISPSMSCPGFLHNHQMLTSCPSSSCPAQSSPESTRGTGLPSPPTSTRTTLTPNTTTCTPCPHLYTIPMRPARPCTSLLPAPRRSTRTNNNRVPGPAWSRTRGEPSMGHHPGRLRHLPVGSRTHTHLRPDRHRAQFGPRAPGTPTHSGTEGMCLK